MSNFKEHVFFVYKISWGALVGTLALYGVVAMVVQWVGTIVACRTLGKLGHWVVEVCFLGFAFSVALLFSPGLPLPLPPC